MTDFFKILTSAITLYSFLCFIRVMFTWFPNLSYSTFGRFLSQICDPYLNIFRKLPLRIGALDFSALIAFAVLMGASSITGNLALGHAISVGGFLVTAVKMIWNIISSLLTCFIVFLVVRLIVNLTNTDRGYSNIWTQIDYSLNPIIFKISALFFGKHPVSFQKSLVISIISVIVFKIAFSYIIAILCTMLAQLPF